MSPARPESDEVIAAVDIGTNSTHMVVARLTGTGFEVITREKSQTRLGEGGGDMKKLSPAAMDRGVTALRHMRQIADAHGARIVAVATSAVREAANAAQFVRRVRDEAGIDIEVISGLEEARLIHSAVLRALPLGEKPTILVDIGGGSTEVVVFSSHVEHFARSFKLGSVRLTHRFFSTGAPSHRVIDTARRHVESTVEPARAEVRRHFARRAVVTSGTGETIARMCRMLDSNEAPRAMNGAVFTRAQLAEVCRMLVEAGDNDSRGRLPGMDPTRADIILAGAVILDEMARSFGVKEFAYCDYALREGLLINEMNRLSPGAPDDSRHVALESATKFATRCDNDFPHALTVSRLACALFDQLCAHFELDEDDRILLEIAALLANVGMTVSHARHHLHSYYMIRNADLLGLTDDEIEVVAQVARYHRKSEPKESHDTFMALPAPDRARVRMLSAVLRVAIGLDRTHDGRVEDVGIDVDDTTITVVVEAAGSVNLDLNLHAAAERASLLADVFAHKVALERRQGR